ncbi:uncharacterized protein [Argopecten irradians]|uniref:uncharacterized protein n=1 Tax=Argopecten irradians TaxID=31199 RepID=UPI003712AFF3
MGNVKHLLRYLSFGLLIWNVTAVIEDIDIPPELLDCFTDWDFNENISTIAGQNVLHTCMSDYLWKTGKERWSPDVDPRILQFISEDVREREKYINEPTDSQTTTASPYKNLRIRKEYRTLTQRERRKYHRAVQALKKDKRLKPNTYDAIANYHNAKIQYAAHGGPSFLGWHRIYLMTYEDALRRMDPDVTLPYWDCRYEEAMEDPSKSMLFSRHFAGNGDGEVDTGPFKDWTHDAFGKLTRAVSKGAELMGYEDVKNILSRNNTSEITIPTADSTYNLEYHHGKIHLFVDGHLSDLVSAAHDPLFFMLHAFIDYIWWMFRNKQEENGIDPSQDYPETLIERHQPDRTMDGFEMYQNIDGYSLNWTRDIYTYEISPTECSEQYPSCNSKWLTCQFSNKRCVSKARRSNSRSKSERLTAFTDSALTEVNSVEDFTPDTCSKLDSTIQNTFSVDGFADSSKWSYIPIKIVNERKQFELFRSFDVVDGSANETLDIFDSEKYDALRRKEDNGKLGTYRKCKISGSGATKIFVNAYGLNYFGVSTEYTIVDERMALSEGYAFVPIKKPTEKPSEVFFAAYDSCGRLCKPYCRKNGKYQQCTAVLRVGNISSEQFGDTYGDAFLNTWDFDGDGIPEVNKANVYLSFYCNRKEEWPWQPYTRSEC